ncbi:MAG TPA: hypothetical protein VE085_06675 [Burkholderiales bacterium]|nr:hypothetical protein [Burkholderiales bacterium]
MADNVYTKVLQQAAELEGSTQALAARLRVPENTLLRWMSGRAQMPLQAFFNAMEFVGARESQTAVQASGASDEKLSFNVGPVLAHCSRCEGTEFRRADPNQPLHYARNLACRSCGTEVNYGRLVVELARETSVHARSRLAALKQREAERKARTLKARAQ